MRSFQTQCHFMICGRYIQLILLSPLNYFSNELVCSAVVFSFENGRPCLYKLFLYIFICLFIFIWVSENTSGFILGLLPFTISFYTSIMTFISIKSHWDWTLQTAASLIEIEHVLFGLWFLFFVIISQFPTITFCCHDIHPSFL